MKHSKMAGLAAVGLLLASIAPLAVAQRDYGHDYGRARGIVAQTHGDLRRVSRRETISPKERERYDNALRHLSEFDQGLANGKFDKGKLDQTIDDINNVCKNNTLGPRDRDVLLGDLQSLRDLRASWR
ncbi:MAG TPA: hypothetical protein VKV15_02025 [Bryobacteraceae bacterium]|nr:hypothetical protein [Bryobacteraceae bacterium]